MKTARRRDAAPSLIVLSLLLVATAGAVVSVRHHPARSRTPAVRRRISTRGNIPPDLPRRVLIVYNTRSEESHRLAERYANRRAVPQSNLIGISCPLTDECSRTEFESAILPLIRKQAKDDPSIGYVVLMRGIPYRFSDWGNLGGFSLDSVLSTCLLPIASTGIGANSRIPNPYFGADARFDQKLFGGMLLVCRLDGPTDDDAFAPVESGLSALPIDGPFYFRDSFCMSMQAGNEALKRRSLETEYVTPANNPLAPLYQGEDGPYMAHWGAGPHDTQYSDAKFAALRFLPGGICDLTWSASAADLHNRQAKAGINLLTAYAGAAGAHGFVSEPYCDSVSRSEIVLDRYTRGYTLAESFYMGMPYLHWKDVVLGDPLCAPYADRGINAPVH